MDNGNQEKEAQDKNWKGNIDRKFQKANHHNLAHYVKIT